MFLKRWLLLGALTLSMTPSLFADDQPTAADRNEAMAALKILGASVEGSSQRCSQCHNVTLTQLNEWMWMTDSTRAKCFLRQTSTSTPNSQGAYVLSAAERINCLRMNPQDPRSSFDLMKMGVYAAGTHTSFFSTMFKEAYGVDWQNEYDRFKGTMQMPQGGQNLMSESEFNTVIAWMNKGMPAVEDILASDVNAPRTCRAHIDEPLMNHITAMSHGGWEAKNRERGMVMFGCSPGEEKLECFKQKDGHGVDIFPESRTQTFSANWTQAFQNAQIRILKEFKFRTSYWTRVSPDGRFVGYGGNSSNGLDKPSSETLLSRRSMTTLGDENEPLYFGAGIADLQAELLPGRPGREIKVSASYDPSFFPDGSGFAFQATPVGAGFCPLSLIEDPATTQVTFSEEGCSGTNSIPTYQAVGASLDGTDYLAITGRYNSDSGSGTISGADETPGWEKSSYLTFTPMLHDGSKYVAQPNVTAFTPYLGDFNLSPSGNIVSARMSGVNPAGEVIPLGYHFLQVQKIRDGNTYKFDVKEVGAVCIKGGKAKFSYDERMFANFHYADKDDYKDLGFATANDPKFLEYMNKGTANIYVTDVLSGQTKRVTNMAPGQFAMFPHYRSDGWLYFLVFDKNAGKRYMVSTDASLRMYENSPATH